MQLQNSVAIITGGASGLGEASLRRIVANGGKAAILDLDEKRGQRLADELGDKVIFFKTDVTDDASVTAAIDGAINQFGELRIVINCAGVGTPMKVLSKNGVMPMENFTRTVQINLFGTMNVIRLAAEKMVTSSPMEDGEKGVVINTASVAAFDGQIGQAAYSASKSAIVGMTLPISREFAEYGIRVMTIAPGIFETPMVEVIPEEARNALAQSVPFPKRLGKPDEFAMLVQQIIENPMLNGETIRLDACIRMPPR